MSKKQIILDLGEIRENLRVLRDEEEDDGLLNRFDGDQWDIVDKTINTLDSVIDQVDQFMSHLIHPCSRSNK